MAETATQATFTPGPYNIRPLKGPYGYDVEIDVEPDCTWQVARVNGHTPEQALANAHLIAAAPEMDEALQQIRTHATVYNPESAIQKRVVRICDESIAKAEGRNA